MRSLSSLVRPNVLQLIPYSSARTEYSGKGNVFLDANENPYGTYNRYPDPMQTALKRMLCKYKQVDESKIFIGNGSDEIIDLCFRIFCRPGLDKAIIFTPTYGMYEVSASINDVKVISIPLNASFHPETDKLDEYANDSTVKLLILCSPNNPTGNLLGDVDELLNRFKGIVLLDEAYIDFAVTASYIGKLAQYPNLIVTQTLSKAYGLAAARIGIAYASTAIIDIFNRVKPPYNISSLNQEAAIAALMEKELHDEQVKLLISERSRVLEVLKKDELANYIYPSDANFLLVHFVDAEAVYQYLRDVGIISRNRNKVIEGCIRITIGTPEENNRLLNALRNFKNTNSK